MFSSDAACPRPAARRLRAFAAGRFDRRVRGAGARTETADTRDEEARKQTLAIARGFDRLAARADKGRHMSLHTSDVREPQDAQCLPEKLCRSLVLRNVRNHLLATGSLTRPDRSCLLKSTISTDSDSRLKTDVVRVGQLENGLPLYRFRYVWSNDVYVGVMAHEVLPVVPYAVIVGEDGFMRVNYGMLGTRLMTWSEWQRSTAPDSAGAGSDYESLVDELRRRGVEKLGL